MKLRGPCRRQEIARSQAVHHHACVHERAAVNRQGGDLQIVRAADILKSRPPELDAGQAGDESRQVVVAPAGWNGVDDLVADHVLTARVLDVDHGRLANDGDRFLHGSDGHVSVDRGCERAHELDALSHDRVEAGQRERGFVGTRSQVDDSILPCVVGDGHTGFLDQGGARHFYSDTGQHGTRRILHRACNGSLRVGREWRERSKNEHEGPHASNSQHRRLLTQ